MQSSANLGHLTFFDDELLTLKFLGRNYVARLYVLSSIHTTGTVYSSIPENLLNYLTTDSV